MKRSILYSVMIELILIITTAVCANSTTIIQPKTEFFKKIISYLYMSKDEILIELGNRYEPVEIGAEGVIIGYYYRDIGIIFAFDDDGNVSWIECDKNVDINGAKAGMNFNQVQKYLGKVKINVSWSDDQENKLYEINYKIGECIVCFQSYFKDGRNSQVLIFADR